MKKKKRLTAAGITCGIGSMLGAARIAGFEILGNCEWRKYYHKKDPQGRNTFEENFKGAFFVEGYPQDDPKVLAMYGGVDAVFGHPECGAYSALNFANKNFREKQQDAGDIPKFLHAIAAVKPRFFVMDDLPRSFHAMPMSEYHSILPEYDLFPEWISNYHYGNTQLFRKRMFMIGALKKEKWAFVPGEFEHEKTVKDLIGDLVGREGQLPNHEVHVLDAPCGKIADYYERGYRGTWKDFARIMKQIPSGPRITYVAADGTEKPRLGTAKAYWDKHAFVLDGGSILAHPLRFTPLTIRERARIQGFPDSFEFFGAKLDDKGRWNQEKNSDLIKQTGKAMPFEFNTYVARQIRTHIEGAPFEASNERMLDANGLVNDAKRWYCENVGYAAQKKACAACWMRGYCALERFAGDRSAAPPPPPKRAAHGPRKSKFVETKVPRGTVFGELKND